MKFAIPFLLSTLCLAALVYALVSAQPVTLPPFLISERPASPVPGTTAAK